VISDAQDVGWDRMDRIAVYGREKAPWVEKVLGEAKYHVKAHSDWEGFVQAASDSHVAVCIVPALGLDLKLVELEDLAAQRIEPPIILVTRRSVDNLVNLARIVVARIAYLPDHHTTGQECTLLLLHQVRDVLLWESMFDRAARRVASNRNLDPRLSRAVRYILTHGPADQPVERVDRTAPVHSVQALARRISVNEKVLSSLGASAGIDLHAMIHYVLAIQAIQLRFSIAATWDEVAWRIGYSTRAGVFMLIERVSHRKPGQLRASDLTGLWKQVEQRFLNPLMAYQSGGTSGCDGAGSDTTAGK
jgi:hypothetical protein